METQTCVLSIDLNGAKDYYLILNIHLNVNYCAYYINLDIPNEGPYIVGELKNRDLVHLSPLH